MMKSDFDVKLLTYNIFLRPYLIKSNKDDFKSERLELFAKKMKEYDIICLQEAFDNFTHRQHLLHERAFQNGFNYISKSPEPRLLGKGIIDGGLVIYSKYPIEDSDFYSFKHSIFSDSLCRKGVLYAKVILPKGVLHLFTSHDQAQYGYPDKEMEIINYYVRLKQLVEAKNYINRKLSIVLRPGDSTIFMGDLNVDANLEFYPIKEAYILFSQVFCHEYDFCTLTNNEYDLLLYIFNNKQSGFKYTDVFYQEHSKFFVTYGDVYTDSKGKELPLVN